MYIYYIYLNITHNIKVVNDILDASFRMYLLAVLDSSQHYHRFPYQLIIPITMNAVIQTDYFHIRFYFTDINRYQLNIRYIKHMYCVMTTDYLLAFIAE